MFNEHRMVCASERSSSLSTFVWAAHSQYDTINAARSTEIFLSDNPDSIIGIKAAAARRRFKVGVGAAIDFGIC